MEKTLLKTIHGSYLYGLNHAESDEDFYIVVEGKAKSKQIIIDGTDTTVVGLTAFIEACHKGVPQALEAIFSMEASVDEMKELRAGYKAVGSEVIATYLRTIKSFATDKRGKDKMKRHAVRLALNLNEIIKRGRFNPRLTECDKAVIDNIMSHVNKPEVFQKKINEICYLQVF